MDVVKIIRSPTYPPINSHATVRRPLDYVKQSNTKGGVPMRVCASMGGTLDTGVALLDTFGHERRAKRRGRRKHGVKRSAQPVTVACHGGDAAQL